MVFFTPTHWGEPVKKYIKNNKHQFWVDLYVICTMQHNQLPIGIIQLAAKICNCSQFIICDGWKWWYQMPSNQLSYYKTIFTAKKSWVFEKFNFKLIVAIILYAHPLKNIEENIFVLISVDINNCNKASTTIYLMVPLNKLQIAGFRSFVLQKC